MDVGYYNVHQYVHLIQNLKRQTWTRVLYEPSHGSNKTQICSFDLNRRKTIWTWVFPIFQSEPELDKSDLKSDPNPFLDPRYVCIHDNC